MRGQVLLPVYYQRESRHSAFKLPLQIFPDSTSLLKVNSEQADKLKNVDVFIWDECSMIDKRSLSIIDKLLKDISNNCLPFGGKIFILAGDFRQIPPIVPNGTMEQTVSRSIITHNLWPKFKQYKLTNNMRLENGQEEFAKYLLSVGNGTANVSINYDYIKLRDDILFKGNLTQLIRWCFDDFHCDGENNSHQKAILTPLNLTCETINNLIVN